MFLQGYLNTLQSIKKLYFPVKDVAKTVFVPLYSSISENGEAIKKRTTRAPGITYHFLEPVVQKPSTLETKGSWKGVSTSEVQAN